MAKPALVSKHTYAETDVRDAVTPVIGSGDGRLRRLGLIVAILVSAIVTPVRAQDDGMLIRNARVSLRAELGPAARSDPEQRAREQHDQKIGDFRSEQDADPPREDAPQVALYAFLIGAAGLWSGRRVLLRRWGGTWRLPRIAMLCGGALTMLGCWSLILGLVALAQG